MKWPLIFLVWLYQKTLSFDHGPLKFIYPNGFCRFYPSCSEYAKKALYEHGSIKGAYLSFIRILKCNPWSGGGIDELHRNNR